MASVTNNSPFASLYVENVLLILSMLSLEDQKTASLINKEFNVIVSRIPSWQHMKKEEGIEDESERIIGEMDRLLQSSDDLPFVMTFIEKIPSRMIKAQAYWYLSNLHAVRGEYDRALELINRNIPEGLISFHHKDGRLNFRWTSGTIRTNALATLAEVAFTKGDIKSASLFLEGISSSLDSSLKTELRTRYNLIKQIFKFSDEEFVKNVDAQYFKTLLQEASKMVLILNPELDKQFVSQLTDSLAAMGTFQKAADQTKISLDGELTLNVLANIIFSHAGSIILAKVNLI